jgi:hypothetical protein
MEEDKSRFDDIVERFVDIQMEMHSKQVPLLNKLKDK